MAPNNVQIKSVEVELAGDWSELLDLVFPEQDAIWLDSADTPGGNPDRSRWSILAGSDGPFSGRLVSAEGTISWSGSQAHHHLHAGDSLDPDLPFTDAVDQLLRAVSLSPSDRPESPFALGWAGFLGYEVVAPSSHSAGTDAHLLFCDRALVRDHRSGTTAVMAIVAEGRRPSTLRANAANLAWLDRTAALVAAPPVLSPVSAKVLAPDLPERRAAAPVTRAEYEQQVEACRQEIREGNAFQVCLTTTFQLPDLSAALEERELYRALRSLEPVPFGSFLQLGDVTILSRSPERFLSIDRDGRVLAEPIKGTRPRGKSEEEDEQLKEALSQDDKERAENLMIVDLLRNDLSRSGDPRTLAVERLFSVETFASVHQMVSSVSIRLKSAGRAAAVAGAFPPGSMTGAPKSSAMRIARSLEGQPRGVYSGAIGYFSLCGSVDLSVVIRTLVMRRGPASERKWSYGAGGAVTWPSDPRDESNEVLHKSEPILNALGLMTNWRITDG